MNSPITPTKLFPSGYIEQEHLTLFRSLFRGRDDVYAYYWEKEGRKGWAPSFAHRNASFSLLNQYLPLTDKVIASHLGGHSRIGIYPMLLDLTCYFIAADFDESDWQRDALAFCSCLKSYGVPSLLELSRSGKGAHVWIFFDTAIEAKKARRVIHKLLQVAGVLKKNSFDRLFPNQDELPLKKLGNLIHLPLQGRSFEEGKTAFLNQSTLSVEKEPWEVLRSI